MFAKYRRWTGEKTGELVPNSVQLELQDHTGVSIYQTYQFVFYCQRGSISFKRFLLNKAEICESEYHMYHTLNPNRSQVCRNMKAGV